MAINWSCWLFSLTPPRTHQLSSKCRPRQLSSGATSTGNESDIAPSQEVWNYWGICRASKLWEWAFSFLISTWELSKEIL
eukprot:390992-Pelagomonas_calceolata.AAC.1